MIGNPVQQGSTTVDHTNTHTTTSVGPVTIPANSLVIVAIQTGLSGSDPGDPSAVSDGTNSYVKDATSGGPAGGSNVSGRVTCWSFYDAAGGSKTITATLPAVSMSFMAVFTIANAATSGAFDQTGHSGTTSSTSLSVTTAGTLAQADEVAFGIYTVASQGAPTTWPGAGSTSLVDVVDATRSVQFLVEYENGWTAGATATQTGLLSVAAAINRLITTYKGVAATLNPGVAQQRRRWRYNRLLRRRRRPTFQNLVPLLLGPAQPVCGTIPLAQRPRLRRPIRRRTRPVPKNPLALLTTVVVLPTGQHEQDRRARLGRFPRRRRRVQPENLLLLQSGGGGGGATPERTKMGVGI